MKMIYGLISLKMYDKAHSSTSGNELIMNNLVNIKGLKLIEYEEFTKILE